MSCGYSKEILALYIEDDLPTDDAVKKVDSHVADCAQCQTYCEQLRKAQSFIRSRFRLAHRESVSQESLTSVRRNVMSQIDSASKSLGWAVRLERFFMLGLRSQRYAIAGFAFLAIVSVSLLGQIRYTRTGPAVFVADNTMLLPNGYREWVFVGSSLGLGYSQKSSSDMYHNVYINPAAYSEYVHSGKFPDGTVMVLEMLSAEKKDDPELSGSYEKNFMGVEVSVKDSSRFSGGWGFYNFTDDNGKVKPQADQLPETAGCLSCHRDKAATDHVFTQFYPVLRGIGSRGAI
jgi:hypothetical protein